jgi:adenosylcobinamide kinase/adenosylcobinamide-phosphate guanylyltransferase
LAITLILGGTKTGKTTFAQNRALEAEERTGKPVVYMATAKALDDEMTDRISKHKTDRPSRWITIEEELKVSMKIKEECRDTSAIILDCLTLMMTNIILEKGEDCPKAEALEAVFTEVDALIEAASELDSELLIISNQVEVGLVSPYRLGRMFQDIAGMTHQKIAAKSNEVYLMTAGIAVKIK